MIIEMAAGPHEMSKACAIQGATMDAFQYIGLHQPLSREGVLIHHVNMMLGSYGRCEM